MISIEDLEALATARLEDARVLLENQRFDSAEYLCGYAVEIALKARICIALNWPGFPATRAEFESYSSLKTHKLEVLLRFSGQEDRIRKNHRMLWAAVANWDPETRYQAVGTANRNSAQSMWDSAILLLGILNGPTA